MKPLARSAAIEKIHLENIRGFRSLDLDLRRGAEVPGRRTLIIGKNGTCKTTLLRALAIGLADFSDATSLLSEPLGGLVTAGAEAGGITILVGIGGLDGEGYEFHQTLYRKAERETLEESEAFSGAPDHTFRLIAEGRRPALFVAAYGAGRFGSGVFEDSGQTYRISDSVATLFRYQQPLNPPELTLRRLREALDGHEYEHTLQRLMRALDLPPGHKIRIRRGGGVEVAGPSGGRAVPLESWADGYRLTFSWILDLYAWAMRAGCIDEEGHISGILLIDEIEQHLHPTMQAEILPRLSEILPKMQIFATTHSPLVALDAHPSEVVVLRRQGDEIVAEQSLPDFRGYSVEDMLTDPRLFETPQAYGQEKTEKLSRYRELAAIPKVEREPEQARELRALASELQEQPAPESRESAVVRELRELAAKRLL